jgi:hypothetical protein
MWEVLTIGWGFNVRISTCFEQRTRHHLLSPQTAENEWGEAKLVESVGFGGGHEEEGLGHEV